MIKLLSYAFASPKVGIVGVCLSHHRLLFENLYLYTNQLEQFDYFFIYSFLFSHISQVEVFSDFCLQNLYQYTYHYEGVLNHFDLQLVFLDF